MEAAHRVDAAADAQALVRVMHFLRARGFGDAAAALEGRGDCTEFSPALVLGREYISTCASRGLSTNQRYFL
jgi:hypothetical protein